MYTVYAISEHLWVEHTLGTNKLVSVELCPAYIHVVIE